MFEDNSIIEEFRVNFHGASTLRLLERKRDSGRKWRIVASLTKGFFIGADEGTSEGQRKEILTLEMRYSPSLTKQIIEKAIALDLVAPDGSFKRYSFGSKTDQSFLGTRFVGTINADFSDTMEIE